MSLLGGDIQNVFGEAFAGVYGDGLLHPQSKTNQIDGDITASSGSDIDIKCQVAECTQKQMEEDGYDAKDVAIRILQKGVGIELSNDHEITADDGVRYEIGPIIRQDSARSYWLVRGRKIG